MSGVGTVADGLLDVLRSHTGTGRLTLADPLQPLPGGFSNDLYSFTIDDAPPDLNGRLVLRLMHDDRDASRETIIHRAVADAGFPAPAVKLSGDASAGLGRPFLVIEHVHGQDCLRALGVPKAFARIPDLLAGLMAELHAVDPRGPLGELEANQWTSDGLGAPGVLAEIDARLGVALGRRFDRLRGQRLEPGPLTIVHGDMHGLNILMHDGEVQALLDWELARVTDAEFDVARTKVILDTVPGMSSRFLRPLVQSFGRRAGRAFVLSYSRQRELDEDRLRFWEAAHCLRLVAMVSPVQGARAVNDNVADLWAPLRTRLLSRFDQLLGPSGP